MSHLREPLHCTVTRRQFLRHAGAAAAAPLALFEQPALSTLRFAPAGTVVNDVHSRMNPTVVRGIIRPADAAELRRAIAETASAGERLCVAGGRHAMGGQQFADNGVLVDTRSMNRVLSLDRERGLARVEAGIQWPELIEQLGRMQQEGSDPGVEAGSQAPPNGRSAHPVWSIRQKQTGADRLTIGGAVSANVHGRGLSMKPFVEDVESFDLIDARGELRTCSRSENAELFRLVVGGYGLFGVVSAVTLRLMPRTLLRRRVELTDTGRLMERFEQRIAEGCLFGDFQFEIAADSPGFLRRGVLSCYQPVDGDAAAVPKRASLSADDWSRLIELAHADKRRAFDEYSRYYLSTDGQLYASDTHQLSLYLDDYHDALNRRLGGRGSETIAELYVPRERLAWFMVAAAEVLRAMRADVIYGTIRLIERDDETFLPWARRPYACVVINLHVDHTGHSVLLALETFRLLAREALSRDGSFYLTYGRFATREQIEAAYPRFRDFLRRKQQLDPRERFTSEWYKHHVGLFA